MTHREARDRILPKIGQLARTGAGGELRKDTARMLAGLHGVGFHATKSHDAEVRAAAQDILRVLWIEAEVPES